MNKKQMLKNKIKNNVFAITLISLILIILAVFIIIKMINTEQKDLILNGTVESTEFLTAYVLKEETIIDIDKSKILIPIIPDGQRVAKGDIIATYRGDEYQEYQDKLEEMDKEIFILMKDLPAVYSSEIDNIDELIYTNIKKIINENSYISLQEHKNTINNYIKMRADIIARLSPDGAAIKDKIEQRNNYEDLAKKSNHNVIALSSGIVTYKVDSLENLDSKDYSVWEENIVKYNPSSNIKIVDNYLAYIITKTSKNNLEYINLNKSYKIRLKGDLYYEYIATIESKKEVDDRS